jgi:hypothetical protein
MALRFLDVSGLLPAADSWEVVYYVYHAVGKIGVIDRQTETGYYRFLPDGPAAGTVSLGDFDPEILKRRIAEWLNR